MHVAMNPLHMSPSGYTGYQKVQENTAMSCHSFPNWENSTTFIRSRAVNALGLATSLTLELATATCTDSQL